MKSLLIIDISGAQCFVALAQSSPRIASAGHSPPAPLKDAPGQVVTMPHFSDLPRSSAETNGQEGRDRTDQHSFWS
jgi:hypothetical protein